MNGIKVIWYEKKGKWSCEVKKTCGPHTLRIHEPLGSFKGKEPTVGQCIRHENVLSERLKSQIIKELLG